MCEREREISKMQNTHNVQDERGEILFVFFYIHVQDACNSLFEKKKKNLKENQTTEG